MRKVIFLISILLLGSLSQANVSSNLVHFPIVQGQDLIGQATQIGSKTYLTSAHVISSLSPDGYQALLAQLQLPLNNTSMYQFYLNSRYLDAVILTNQRIDHVRSFLRTHTGIARTSDNYFVRAYSSFADESMQERMTMSRGIVNGTYIYLRSEKPKLNLGSSGAAVLSQDPMRDEESLIGLLQCYYPGGTLGTDDELPVFRALTIDTLLASILRPANLSELASRFSHYDLSRCRPIDSKKGGGG